MRSSISTGKVIQVSTYTVTIHEKIGEGGYAIVYRCSDSTREYALKVVVCTSRQQFHQFKQEATFLQSLTNKNPHIVSLFAVTLQSQSHQLLFLFEFCPSSAIGLLSKRLLTKEEVLILFHGCADAVCFLHSQTPPISHRDLKPENILIASDGTPRLCDFGSATTRIHVPDTPESIQAIGDDIELNTTMSYRAPEMVDLYRHTAIGPPADIWALGCTLYKLITRDELFKADERLAILQARLRLPATIDPDLAAIIKDCVQFDPNKRPPAAELEKRTLALRGAGSTIAQMGHADDGRVVGFVKERYRSWVTSGVENWALKATFASNDPPKEKHVRRVVLATIRQPDMVAAIIGFLFSRPWQTDPRIAAKVVYVVLLIAQFAVKLGPLLQLTNKLQEVAQNCQAIRTKKKTIWPGATANLATVINEKLALHQEFPEIEGNLASAQTEIKPGLIVRIKSYVATLSEHAHWMVQVAATAGDFAMNVLANPVVDELANAFTLLRFCNQGASEELQRASLVLTRARQLPFLDSAVEYPDPVRHPPLQRCLVIG